MTEFKWQDLTSEQFREYRFGETIVRIERPLQLHVAGSGSHRILDASGRSHYVPAGWHHLSWVVKDGHEPFEF